VLNILTFFNSFVQMAIPDDKGISSIPSSTGLFSKNNSFQNFPRFPNGSSRSFQMIDQISVNDEIQVFFIIGNFAKFLKDKFVL